MLQGQTLHLDHVRCRGGRLETLAAGLAVQAPEDGGSLTLQLPPNGVCQQHLAVKQLGRECVKQVFLLWKRCD